MRARCTALIAFAFVSGFTTSSAAIAKCETSAMASVQSSYPLQDIAVVADKGPVLQSSVTLGCQNGLTLELWNSAALSGSGKYGRRGYGDEIDFTINYAKKVGKVELEGSIAYYVISDFQRSRDDLVQGYVQAGYPLKIGKSTVTPYVRLQQWWGTPEFPDTSFVRSGARWRIPLSENDRWDFSGDASFVKELDRNRDAKRDPISRARIVKRAAISVGYDLGDDWRVNAGAKFTSRLGPTFVFGVNKRF